MPRFTPNPEAASAGALILDKDDYTFEITKASPFIFDKNPDKISHGVQYSLKIVSEGSAKGKTITARLFMHSTAAEDMSKKFLMCAAGYNPSRKDEEDRFNAEYGPKDWGYDTDDKSVGGGWDSLVGKLLVGQAGEPKENNGMLNQNFAWKVYNP
jgi:hypothetical protein